jgi:hypothetical protein
MGDVWFARMEELFEVGATEDQVAISVAITRTAANSTPLLGDRAWMERLIRNVLKHDLSALPAERTEQDMGHEGYRRVDESDTEHWRIGAGHSGARTGTGTPRRHGRTLSTSGRRPRSRGRPRAVTGPASLPRRLPEHVALGVEEA